VSGLDDADLAQLLAEGWAPAVERIERVDAIDGQHLLRVTWDREYQGILRGIVEMDGMLLSGTGTADQWTFEVRSDSHDGVADLQDYCRDHDIPVSVASVHSLDSTDSEAERELTEAQCEALVLAYERGYYDSPRAVTLADLATDLGITGQALGSRLRRGTKRLIERSLVDGD
jgi:predicted DNA binding protein